MTYESWRISYQSSEAAARSAWQEMIRLHHRVNELEAQLSAIGACGVEPLRKQAVRRAPAAPVPQWVRPVSELLGHISDVLPDNAFNKIDTAKWNAVSALVGATQAAAAPVQMPEPAGWRDPSNLLPSQGCTCMRAIHGKWQHIYRELLYIEQQVRALLAEVSSPAAQEGWCDGCSPDNCVGCGPAAPAQVQPEPNREQS